MDAAARDEALEELAGSLRDRLLGEAGAHAGDLHERIRALVDREAGLLDADARGRLAPGSPSARSGSGRWSRCSPIRRSTRSWSTGPAGLGRARRAPRADGRALRQRGRAAPRDRADPRAARAPRRRGRAALRRTPARRLTGQRRHPAARARRPGADDPPLSPARLHPRRARRERHLGRAAARPPRARGARALQHPRQRRHRLGQDDDAQRAVGVHPRRRADRDDRGHRRAAPAAGPRRAPRGAAGRRGGPGEVTIRRLVRNALRMRPDRIVVGEVRGAEALDMLSAMSSGHDGSLSTVHAGSPGGGAAAGRDARAHGRARPAARGDPRAGRRRAGPRRPPGAAARRHAPRRRRRRGRAGRRRPGTRELYALRDGRPAWRAPLGDALAARLRAGRAAA